MVSGVDQSLAGDSDLERGFLTASAYVDVPGCDRTPRMGTRGNKLRQDKRKRKKSWGALGLGVDRLIQ